MVRKGSTLTYALIAAALCFCFVAATVEAAELELAGIKLGRSALTIIQKYGNPSEIRVGASSGAASSGQQGTGFGEAPPPGFPTGPPPELGGPPAGVMEGPPSGFPGAGSMPSATSGITGQQGRARSRPTGTEVTWVYRFPKSRQLEFIIDPQGLVIQIAAYGAEWQGLKTSKGITLGSTYRDVILKYGYPETHQRQGMEMVTKYVNTHRVAFTFIGKTVVAITIAFFD